MRSRRNPITKLAALAFSDRPELVQEMRSAKKRYQFETAASLLSKRTGRDLRQHGLSAIAGYVRSFSDPAEALAWLAFKNLRLGVWCAAALARCVLPAADGEKAALRAIESAEGWARGSISAAKAWKAGDQAWNLSSLRDGPAEQALLAAARAAQMTSYAGSDSHRARTAAAVDAASVVSDVQQAVPTSNTELLAAITDAVMTFPKRGR